MRVMGRVCVVRSHNRFWFYVNDLKCRRQGYLSHTRIQGLASPQSGNQQALPKDCVNIHNIFRRGLNLLPRFEFKVASFWIQRLVQLTLHLGGVS